MYNPQYCVYDPFLDPTSNLRAEILSGQLVVNVSVRFVVFIAPFGDNWPETFVISLELLDLRIVPSRDFHL